MSNDEENLDPNITQPIDVELASKSKVRRLSMTQRFQVMKLLEESQSRIAQMSSNKEVADFVMAECKVEMSSQTAANYLKELGIPSPGSTGDPVLKAKVAELERKVEGLTDKITEILQYIERQLGINDNVSKTLDILINNKKEEQPRLEGVHWT